MTDERGQRDDIICLVAPRREKKYLLTGILLSLALHGGWLGKSAYDDWQRIKAWGDVLALKIVDEPDAVAARRRAEIVVLTEPLYYPPGLLKSKLEPANEEKDQQHQQPERQPENDHRQASQPHDPEPAAEDQPPPSAEVASSSGELLRWQLQQLRQGVQQAQTLNIGPIRDQITSLYRAQQEGRIAVRNITVAVNFHVRQDGSFTRVRLIESSGVSDVDNAALIVVDELNELRSLAPLRETDSVTLRLTVGQDVELQIVAAAPSEAVAAEDVRLLNGLLMAARLWSSARQEAEVAKFLTTIDIKREGANIVARARIPRAEVKQLLERELGSET